MIDDARAVPRASTVQAGVCIVGAGAAGITLARELSSRHDVVLLESGGLEPRTPTQDLYDGSSVGIPYDVRDTRLRYFGGSTNHWSGWCRPLDASDFAARDWVPHSGWPFGRSDLEPYYVRAQDVCDLGPFVYELGAWHDLLPRATSLLETEVFATSVFRIGPAVRFGEEYGSDLRAARNVRVLLRANAVNVRLDGSRVAGVDVATLSGNRFRVDAPIVVVATGGIENARLLLASRDDHRSGIGNAHDLVGRFFTDHPHVLDAGSVVLAQRSPIVALHTMRYVDPSVAVDPGISGSRATPSLLGAITLTESAARERRIPRFGITFNLRDDPSRADLDVLEHLDAVDPAGRDEVPADPLPTFERILKLEIRSEALPNPDSRVTLGSQRDALGMPRADVRWALTEPDWTALNEGPSILGGELGRLGLGRIRGRTPERRDVEGGAHHIGTTRMHTDPRKGVVDANCQVHGVAGLYVAGSSVFPTSGHANPTLTIVALALRLAGHLEQVA